MTDAGCPNCNDFGIRGYRYRFGLINSVTTMVRNALSTAGNSMTSSERPSPGPFLKKEASPAVLPYWGGDNSGTALEASNALNYLGHSSRTLEGNSRKRSESVSRVFPGN